MNKTTSIIAALACAILLAASCSEPDPEEGTDTPPTSDGGTATSTTDTGWTDDELKACGAANGVGYLDAHDVIVDCECVEEEVYETWSMEDYTTDFDKQCYVDGWTEAFLQWCTETCSDGGPMDECCEAMIAWAMEQRPD